MLDEMKCVFPTSGVQSVAKLSAASERTYSLLQECLF